MSALNTMHFIQVFHPSVDSGQGAGVEIRDLKPFDQSELEDLKGGELETMLTNLVQISSATSNKDTISTLNKNMTDVMMSKGLNPGA